MAHMHTAAHRKAILEAADAELRLEGLHRSEATKPIFEALVAGRITSAVVVQILDRHYGMKRDAVRQKDLTERAFEMAR